MVAPLKVDEELLKFCTPRQQEILLSIKKHNGVRPAALADGAGFSYYSQTYKAVKKKADAEYDTPPRAASNVGKTRRSSDEGKRIMVIPDVQAKPGIDFSYLMREGVYAVEKRPDIIVCIGDFADMPSLSSYDKGKKSFEGRRYKRDVEAAHWAMSAFMTPIVDYNAAHPGRPYKPRLVMTLGNHEHRIDRATEDDPKLDGVLSIKDLKYEDFGWEVYPFLETVIIEGVAFSHYFVSGVMGRPTGTAAAQLRAANMSCFSGHQQGKQIAYARRADGAILTSIICGSNYEHDEVFLGPQMNKQHWRGFFVLHDTKNGTFDEMPVSISFVNKRYPHIKAPEPMYSMPTAQELEAGRM